MEGEALVHGPETRGHDRSVSVQDSQSSGLLNVENESILAFEVALDDIQPAATSQTMSSPTDTPYSPSQRPTSSLELNATKNAKSSEELDSCVPAISPDECAALEVGNMSNILKTFKVSHAVWQGHCAQFDVCYAI
jgi:hypothetical protein